jgi:hypothetical protein
LKLQTKKECRADADWLDKAIRIVENADSGDEQKAKGQGIIRNIPCAMITL